MQLQRGQKFEWASAVTITGEVLGVLVQLLLIWIGSSIVWADEVDLPIALLIWCTVAAMYLGTVVIGLNVLARRTRPESPAVRLLVAHPVARVFASITTFGSSLLGLSVAIDLISAIGQGTENVYLEASGVVAMLLSWCMFNWGYARIYYSRYHRSDKPPLEFPGTREPRLVDFVYLSFTNATTFAVSDVKVVSTHMRWTIVWHTSLAFFFNALIIVLTMNTIASGELFSTAFD